MYFDLVGAVFLCLWGGGAVGEGYNFLGFNSRSVFLPG